MDNYILPFLWMRGEEESVIRREISKIAECGIHSVCLEARPHPDFCGPGWWHDFDIVLDEAKKRDMRIWILDDKHFPTGYANGLVESKYPERKKLYIGCTTADIFGKSHERTLNVKRMLKPTIGFWQIGQPVNEEERKNNSLLALIALPFAEGDQMQEKAVDLTDTYDPETGYATFTLPAGNWRVHAIYRTRTDGGNESYINMLDAESARTQIEGVYEAHYARCADEFGKHIAGFFSDEPQLGNNNSVGNDNRLGKKRERIPWSEELEGMLKERWGEAFEENLPWLFAESHEKSLESQARYDYMDGVSRLYSKNFSVPVGTWCREHGVEYIGHVVEDSSLHSRLGMGAAHYFRAMEGQDMAGVDIIGGQYYFGAPAQTRTEMMDVDGEFFHYTLPLLGASSAHLDPRKKGRVMCELFGAYGWNFGVRDMRYLLDHLLATGINTLVPHAFSMAEYPDPDCPPHFYAGGHNPEFPAFAQLMKYANRMCGLLNGGKHVADAAVLYDAEADWAGERMPMQKVLRDLAEHQISADIVSLDMLTEPGWGASFEDRDGHGRLVINGVSSEAGKEHGRLVMNGVSFDALVIPYAQYLPESILHFAERAEKAGFPILFVGELPEALLDQNSERKAPSEEAGRKSEADADAPGQETGDCRNADHAACGVENLSDQMPEPWQLVQELESLSCVHTVMPGQEAKFLQAQGLAEVILRPLQVLSGSEDFALASAASSQAASRHLTLYRYRKGGAEIRMLFNEGPEKAFEGAMSVSGDKRVWHYDGMTNRAQKAECVPGEGGTFTRVYLEAGESCLFVISDGTGNLISGLQDAAVREASVLPEGAALSEVTVLPEGAVLIDGLYRPAAEKIRNSKAALDLSEGWMVTKTDAISFPEFPEAERVKKLEPVSRKNPDFSGVIRYTKEFTLDRQPKEAFFEAEEVYEILHLTVNGKEAGMCLTPPYRMEIGGLLQEGQNTITAEVLTTPGRDQLRIPQPPFDFSHAAMDPTGMYGKIRIFIA